MILFVELRMIINEYFDKGHSSMVFHFCQNNIKQPCTLLLTQRKSIQPGQECEAVVILLNHEGYDFGKKDFVFLVRREELEIFTCKVLGTYDEKTAIQAIEDSGRNYIVIRQWNNDEQES